MTEARRCLVGEFVASVLTSYCTGFCPATASFVSGDVELTAGFAAGSTNEIGTVGVVCLSAKPGEPKTKPGEESAGGAIAAGGEAPSTVIPLESGDALKPDELKISFA